MNVRWGCGKVGKRMEKDRGDRKDRMRGNDEGEDGGRRVEERKRMEGEEERGEEDQ